MLTVQGLGYYGHASCCGLGKYMLGEDFTCAKRGSIYRCKVTGTNWASTLAGFKELQTTIRAVSSQMSAVGALAVPSELTTLVVDGQPGNATAMGAQFIGAAFMAAVPPDDPEVKFALTPSGNGQADIEKIATYAKEIAAYFNYVAINHPEALRPIPQVVEVVKEVEKIVKKEFPTRFRPIGAIVLASGFLALLGITATAVHFMRRPNGSPSFPPEDF